MHNKRKKERKKKNKKNKKNKHILHERYGGSVIATGLISPI